MNNNVNSNMTGGVVNNTVNQVANNGINNTVNQIPGAAVNTVSTNTNTVPVRNVQNNVVSGKKKINKFYLWSGIIVGIVLIAAILLLVCLLNGSIDNRNRLTCTSTSQEDGYTRTIQRYYTFDNNINQKVNYTYTFNYTGGLTDEVYNTDFDAIINDPNHGATKYGFGTQITRDGNIVTITAYEPSYWSETYDEIKALNKDEGYSCK